MKSSASFVIVPGRVDDIPLVQRLADEVWREHYPSILSGAQIDYMPGIYDQHLDRRAANYAPLTPLSFIARTAYTWPQRTAVVHGPRRYTWQEAYARSRRLASALAHRGIGIGDTVAAMLANTPEMVECHFGVPMAGGVLNTLNTRLDAEAIAFMGKLHEYLGV